MAGTIVVNGTEYRLDARPSVPDLNDWQFKAPPDLLVPDDIDLKPWFTYDQGQEGSCTANAQAKGLRITRKLQGLSDYHPSRAFIYYNSRMMEGTQNSDSGSTIGDSIKGITIYGACSEEEFAYIVGGYATKPPVQAYTDGLQFKALKYESVGQTADMIGAALALGHAVSIGIVVHQNFESVGSDGIIPMPAGGMLGGHNLLITGRHNLSRKYIVDNSWGQWGLSGPTAIPGTCDGRALMDYDYVHNPNLTFEIKTIDTVDGTPTPPPVLHQLDGIGFLLEDNTVILGWPVGDQFPIVNGKRVKGIGVHFNDNYATEVWHNN